MEFRPLTALSVHLESLIKGRLWLQVIIGLFLGAAVGILLNPSTGLVSESFGSWLANWMELPGQIFMRLIQMVMIPDRKSTRLNSSHVRISYAVFCLKKKKKHT